MPRRRRGSGPTRRARGNDPPRAERPLHRPLTPRTSPPKRVRGKPSATEPAHVAGSQPTPASRARIAWIVLPTRPDATLASIVASAVLAVVAAMHEAGWHAPPPTGAPLVLAAALVGLLVGLALPSRLLPTPTIGTGTVDSLFAAGVSAAACAVLGIGAVLLATTSASTESLRGVAASSSTAPVLVQQVLIVAPLAAGAAIVGTLASVGAVAVRGWRRALGEGRSPAPAALVGVALAAGVIALVQPALLAPLAALVAFGGAILAATDRASSATRGAIVASQPPSPTALCRAALLGLLAAPTAGDLSPAVVPLLATGLWIGAIVALTAPRWIARFGGDGRVQSAALALLWVAFLLSGPGYSLAGARLALGVLLAARWAGVSSLRTAAPALCAGVMSGLLIGSVADPLASFLARVAFGVFSLLFLGVGAVAARRAVRVRRSYAGLCIGAAAIGFAAIACTPRLIRVAPLPLGALLSELAPDARVVAVGAAFEPRLAGDGWSVDLYLSAAPSCIALIGPVGAEEATDRLIRRVLRVARAGGARLVLEAGLLDAVRRQPGFNADEAWRVQVDHAGGSWSGVVLARDAAPWIARVHGAEVVVRVEPLEAR